MKKIILLLAISLMVISCSKENANNETTADLIYQQNQKLSAKEQTPAASLDNDLRGIYLGVYVSGYTQERGLIWVNLGNNGKYNAIVEMTSGVTLKFQGQSVNKGEFNYHFTAKNAEFDIVLENNIPVIENASLNDELFFGRIVKDKSNTRAMAETGTYLSDSGTIGGTWNLIADGTIVNPNGFGGEGITELVVTRNGHVFTDTTFEPWNFACVGNPGFVPIIVSFTDAEPDSPATWDQTSNFNGVTQWGILMGNDGGVEYLDPNCDLAPSGWFVWDGILTGSVFIDII